MPTEASIQAACVRWLRDQGCICIKLSVFNASGTRGWPDYLVLFPGDRHCFIEFKQPGKTLTRLQERRIQELKELSHRAFVCRSKFEVQAVYEAMKET